MIHLGELTVNTKAIFKWGVILGFLINSSTIVAGEGHHHFSGDPVKSIAEIVMGLKHFPSKKERTQLKDISSHSKDTNIKTISHALINMRHSLKAQDKDNLENILNDKNVSEEIKMLAEIVHNLNHKPSRADKQKLSTLTGH